MTYAPGGSSPTSQSPFLISAITTANTYQKIANSAPNGGVIQSSSAPGTPSFAVDWTSGASNGGSTLSSGAIIIDPPPTAGRGGSLQYIPPTLNPVYVFGPVGATFTGNFS